MNKQRLQRVLDNMEAQGLDQILVTSTASVFYLTGYWIEPHERMLALYIDKNGRTALYGNEIFGVEATADLPVIPTPTAPIRWRIWPPHSPPAG